MESKPKHQKITTYEKQEDGKVNITQESYYDDLAQVIREVQENQLSTAQTLPQDVGILTNKRMITDKSLKLTLTIVPRKEGGYRITEKYMQYKQKF